VSMDRDVKKPTVTVAVIMRYLYLISHAGTWRGSACISCVSNLTITLLIIYLHNFTMR
jgi:hypothetical protein